MAGADDVPCFAIRAVQFRRANDHVIFGRKEVGWEGRIGRQRQEWLALKQCLGSKFYAAKLYQRKAK